MALKRIDVRVHVHVIITRPKIFSLDAPSLTEQKNVHMFGSASLGWAARGGWRGNVNQRSGTETAGGPDVD